MNSMIYPDWQSFAYKYRGREEDAFEDLARALFRKEMGLKYGLFQRVNHKGNETDVIEKDGKVIGFQSKYFTNGINTKVIIDSMKGAKENHPEQTHYYIYCNLAFGNPRRRKGQKKTDPVPVVTQPEESIEAVAKQLGLTLVWKQDKVILDEVAVEKWIYDVFFNVSGKLENLIKEEKTHTEIALGNINYSCTYNGKQIHIKRDEIFAQIEQQRLSTIYVIHGDGGCGKTAILHEFYDLHRDEYPICYRKATSLNVKSLADIFRQGDDYSFTEFKEAYKDCERKYFIIDSAEHLDDIEEDTIVPVLLKGLLDHGWCVVFTVRNVFAGDLLNLLKSEIPHSVIEKTEVSLLTENVLKSLARAYGISLPKDSMLLDRIRNLFYLSLYTLYYNEIDQQSNDKAFLKLIWDKRIRGKNSRIGYIRENEFEAFVTERMQTGSFFLPPGKYTSVEFYSLIDDEIIANDPSNGLFITHDIFEEWGMYRIVDKKWNEKDNVSSFLTSLGDTRAIRRTFRLWLKDRATESPETIEEITKAAFSSELPWIWKDEVLCALLLSDRASQFFSPYEEKILGNQEGLADKIVWALRVGGQYVKEVIPYKEYYFARYAPIGSGWKYIIDLLYQNQDKVQISMWLPILLDWTKGNNRGETTRKVGLMLVSYYQSDAYQREKYQDGIKKLIHEIANNVVWEVKEELSELLHKCIGSNELSDDLPEFILRESIGAMNIHWAIPQTVIDLCLYYWREHEDEGEDKRWPFGHHSRPENTGFGMDENGVAFKYFPPGANQTPTMALLIANEKLAVDFIICLMNECIETYASSKYEDYLIKVDIKDDGKKVNWQWHSATLWGMYRGMGSPVSPYSLQSVHMALEAYLLELSKEKKYDQCEAILKRLLYECHSSSVSAVATSLVLAYPHQYWRIAMILFHNVSFFQTDLSRVNLENGMVSFYEMGGRLLNPMVTDERVATCNQAFRKSHLENVCLHYQFYGSPGLTEEQNNERLQKIYGILDEHRKLLKDCKGEARDHLEIMLSRMDMRRLKVQDTRKVEGGYEIRFETKLNKSAKQMSENAAVDQQEMFKYLGLMNWAIAKMKGETPPNKAYGDDVEKVVKSAKSLQEELANGREPYLTDDKTLPWVAPCLIKFYKDQLSPQDKEWCRDVVEHKLQGFQGLYDVLDGTSACIHVLPCLIELFPEEKEKYALLLLRCLMIPDYGSISASDCATTAIRQFNLWEKEPALMNSLFHKYLESTSEQTIAIDEVHEMKTVFGLVPDDPDEEVAQIIANYLKSIPSLIAQGHEAVHQLFAVTDSLAELFMRTGSKTILSALQYTDELVKENYLGDTYLMHLIVLADSYKKPDRFWRIWNSYRPLVSEMAKGWGKQQLRTYMLNIKWKDGVKEWHSLRFKDLEFFTFMAEHCEGNAAIFNGLVKILTTVGSNYKKEGMGWLAAAINKYPNMNLKETAALMYLELVMLPYVYANKMQIRRTPKLLAQVRAILNFMVAKSSVTGYVLRDLVN